MWSNNFDTSKRLSRGYGLMNCGVCANCRFVFKRCLERPVHLSKTIKPLFNHHWVGRV